MRRQGGIAYIGLLLAIALIGVVAGTAADVYQQSRQRQREADLLWIGQQFRAAILSYRDAHPSHSYPPTFDDLLRDPRFVGTLRHLRRIYPDPFTGKPDWELIRAPEGGIAGIRSRAAGTPIKQDNFRPRDAQFAGKTRYADWEFSAIPPAPVPGTPGAPPAPPRPAPGRP